MADMSEVSKEIRRAVDTGKVAFGFKQSEKILLTQNAELIVFSRNAPKEEKARVQEYSTIAGIPCFVFEGSGLELGAVCGKPFVVSFLTVQDSGKSKVLTAIKETESASSKKAEKKVSKKTAKKKEKKAKKAADKEAAAKEEAIEENKEPDKEMPTETEEEEFEIEDEEDSELQKDSH
ncbi:MAG: 50S ribosomal protein L30e [Candidatus Diapherotrites archaeon]|nr:50S ribosomal protein L30e [Candidatus Diapherotrites archaeon]